MVSPTAQPPPREADQRTVVHFTGDRVSLNECTLQRVRDDLLALADEPGEWELLLDFGNVGFVTSAALDTLVNLHKKLLAGGRRLAICNLAPQVHEVFAVTRVDELLDLRADVRDSEPAAGRPGGAPAGVLVVDDEEVVRSVLQIWLHTHDFEPWVAAGGRQAIELFRRHPGAFAAVLLDVNMPGLDGPGTLEGLKQLCPGVRCCFMSANPAPYTEETLLRMGAVRFFRKPFAVTEVVETLNRLTGRSPRLRRDRWIETSLQRRLNDVGVESQAG
jgi:anti-sigma B factor antagonist